MSLPKNVSYISWSSNFETDIKMFVLINSWQLSVFGKDKTESVRLRLPRSRCDLTRNWVMDKTHNKKNTKFKLWKEKFENLTVWIFASYKEGRYVLCASCIYISYFTYSFISNACMWSVDVGLSWKILKKRKKYLKCSDFCWVFRCRAYARASSWVLILLPPSHLFLYFIHRKFLV